MVSARSSSGMSSSAMSVVATGSAPLIEYVASLTKPGSSVAYMLVASSVSRSNTTVVLSVGAAGSTGSSVVSAGVGVGSGAGGSGGVPPLPPAPPVPPDPSSPSSPSPKGLPPASGSSSGAPRQTTWYRRSENGPPSIDSMARPSSVRFSSRRYTRLSEYERASRSEEHTSELQ